MNTRVKRAKSTALGKTCNQSSGPNKHLKGPFPTRGAIEYSFIVTPNHFFSVYRISGKRPRQLSVLWFFRIKANSYFRSKIGRIAEACNEVETQKLRKLYRRREPSCYEWKIELNLSQSIDGEVDVYGGWA